MLLEIVRVILFMAKQYSFHVYMPHVLYSMVSGHLCWFHVFALVKFQWTWASVCLLVWVFLFSSGECPEMELLDHIELLFLIFEETSILFSIMIVPIYIPASSAQYFPFLHVLTNMFRWLNLKCKEYLPYKSHKWWVSLSALKN